MGTRKPQKHDIKCIENRDEALRAIIHKEMPEAPSDEWFTRKVMNRLPEKQIKTSMGIPEKICYLAGALLLLTGWGVALGYTWHNGLTMSALTMAAILPLVSLICICVFALPSIKREL